MINDDTQHNELVEVLTDIFERADMECFYRAKNRDHQGNWRNVRTLARRGLNALKADIPPTMAKTEKGRLEEARNKMP
jgi:hypothetical protein